MFDPTKHKESPTFEALQPGPYLLAMTSLERKVSSKGTEYLRCRWVVVGGPRRGASFFAILSINPESEGAMQRLKSYCVAIGYNMKPFDLKKNRDLADVFIGRPFLAQVRLEKNGQYENNDIGYWIKDAWNPDQTRAASEWRSKFLESYDPSKYDQQSQSSNDDGWGTGQPPSGNSGGGRDDFDFADDDIPF